MTPSGQQTTFQNFFLRPVGQEEVTVHDTIDNYVEFLTDSLNPPIPDTLFRFELKAIVLPDSVTDSLPAQPVYDRTSLFTVWKNQPVKPQPVVREAQHTDWLTAIFLLCVVILAWIRFYYARRVKQLFKAAFARHHVNQLIRDGNLTDERITPVLSLIYISALSTIAQQFGYGYISGATGVSNPLLVFLIIMAAIIMYWSGKILLIKFTGNLFRTKQDAGEYILTNFIFNITIGIIIFPLVLVGYYTENNTITYIAVGVLIIGMSLRFLRSISVGITAQSFSVVYLFLYLCTLEILPVLVLYRLLTTTD